MYGHMIVAGGDALADSVAEELHNAGTGVVRIETAADLQPAGIVSATAIVAAGPDDAVNLEIALLARQLNPTVRVVTRLANSVLRDAIAARNGPGAVLDVADLAAPMVVEACLSRTTHVIGVAGIEFVVSGADVPRDGTLRQIYGDLLPVAVVRGEDSAAPGELLACPGRDEAVRLGDSTLMIGTADELTARGISVSDLTEPRHSTRPPLARLRGAWRTLREDVNPNFFVAIIASMSLLVLSSIVLRFAYRQPGMNFIDALYFSTETFTTVGYGDFSFMGQPVWLRLFGIALMLAGVTTTAVLVAFIADLLLSRRLGEWASLGQVRHLTDHVIVVGLGSFGNRVASDLVAAGRDVVVVERDPDNRFLSSMTELGVPVIVGDATLRQSLTDARINWASAVAVLTNNDITNIETGIVSRQLLGDRWRAEGRGVPVVLRIFDRALDAAVAHRFSFVHIRSTVELAAPWFIGAAMGLQVFGTFSVRQRSFMVGGVRVEAGSELDGIRIADLSTQTRVIAIAGTAGPTLANLHPHRDTTLTQGDTVYLVGPYRELLATLRQGQRGNAESASEQA
jgi:Trk K+ transport system NAD-binding subunit